MNNKNGISFLLGIFAFLAELVLLRQMSIFLGSGVKATGIIIFLFILGMGIGDVLSVKNFKKGHIVLSFCSIALMILALSPQIVFNIPSQKIVFVYALSLLVASPGVLAGYFYAEIIKTLSKNKIVIFILFNVVGSLVGCILSFIVLSSIGIRETLIILSFLLIPFLINKKGFLVAILIIDLGLIFAFMNSNPQTNPSVYHDIVNETMNITLPFRYEGNITPLDVLFDKPSLYGEVIVDTQYNLYVHNEEMCSNNSTDERTLSDIVSKLEPNATKVLVIGLGCGMTLDEYLHQNSNAQIKLLEINPVVVEAQKLFFNETNNPINNPRVELSIGDGFQYLADSNEKFDVILVDVSNPLAVESTQIYTQEFVKLVHSHLTNSGKVAWWNTAVDKGYHRVLFGTISSVFPYVIVKRVEYSNLYFASKTPFYINISSEDAQIMNEFESEPYIINSINKPVFR